MIMTIDDINKEIRILVVDDCHTIRTMMVKSLEELGFRNVTLAEDGEEAINLVAKKTMKVYRLNLLSLTFVCRI